MYRKPKIVQPYVLKRRAVLAFGFFFLMLIITIYSWKVFQSQPKVVGTIAPLRQGLSVNEWIFSTMFSNQKLSRTYAKQFAAARVRVNGDIGLGKNFDTANWKLAVLKTSTDTIFITLSEIKALPKTTITFDFKCIEGWNQITNWGGVRFSDFIKKYNLTEQSKLSYVGMVTPDSAYYVGIDMASMMHQQTILAYEMNGAALPLNQGYPLRLIIPVKYGVKHLKRIGSINFSNQKPKDYWHELGYDYFCGL
jgi:hypothetical protein